ncbi:tail fiber assembly protein [Burkholderia pseudomallei]|uniref:tail fiber assembly protein n=1 Tax=Burkholderia pseudomallei TaxID=28450 RepID=UPI000A1A2026|nr:tail fiber assembly protein [Burkholderia pseudomallei]ARL38545.1 tail assembly chaperone [Burkholderia pseudomallei]
MGTKFAACDSKFITAFYDTVDSPVPEGVACTEITEAQWKFLLEGQAQGKRMALDDDGVPVLIDPPPPTVEQIIVANTVERDRLLERASVALAPLQMAMSLGDATDDEKAVARQWVAFSRATKAVDLSVADPAWPAEPEIAGSN